MALVIGKVVVTFNGVAPTKRSLDIAFDHVKFIRKRGQKEYVKYTSTVDNVTCVLFEDMLEVKPRIRSKVL